MSFCQIKRFLNVRSNLLMGQSSGLRCVLDKNVPEWPQMRNYCSQVTIQATPVAIKNKEVSKAMKAYLERAREHDRFMRNQEQEFQIGKRHLANIMGADPETFSQDDIDVSCTTARYPMIWCL